MVRRESARSVLQGCFLREWRSPFVQGTVKRRWCAVLASLMHLAKPHWQARNRATQRVLLPASCSTKVTLLVQQPAKPRLPGLRD
jgi:hypothetical protein